MQLEMLGQFFQKKFAVQKNKDKEEVQFQTLQNTPMWRAYEERKNFPTIRIEKGIHLPAVRWV